jgi:NADH-quinone oxidoreductase subunit C
MMDHIVKELDGRFGVVSSRQQRPDLGAVEMAAKDVVAALEWLKRHGGYIHLTHFSVVDWLEEGLFQLVYIVTDPLAHHTLMLSTRIGRDDAEAESIHTLWPEAVTYEQEHNEMYGIRFPGSPRQGVDFLLEGWTAMPPMRRDFDTVKYCEETYDFRPGRLHVDPKEVRAKFQAERKRLAETQKAAAANANEPEPAP